MVPLFGWLVLQRISDTFTGDTICILGVTDLGSLCNHLILF